MQHVSDRRNRKWSPMLVHLDVLLLFSTLAVSALGVLMVYSATRAQLAHQGLDPHYYLKRQVVYTLIGLVVMAAVAAVDYRRYEELGILAYGGVLVGLLGVVAVGHSALGSQRWFQLGSFQLQPSAFAALALVLVIAAYCHRHQDGGLTPRRLAALLTVAGVPILLVFKQPDLGTAIIMSVVLIAMLVVAGVKGRYLAAVAVVGLIGIVAVVNLGLLHTYQLHRLSSFLDQNNPAAAGYYNLQQSKIAIGSGKITGQGLFRSTQTNLGYVPEQYTDFIFTAVGAQLGFVGAASLLALFALMVWRLLRAAQLARDQYGRLLCAGVLALIGFSVFQNAGMTMGIMPITGIPLPLVSYGGSATIAFFAAIGLAINVGMRRYR